MSDLSQFEGIGGECCDCEGDPGECTATICIDIHCAPGDEDGGTVVIKDGDDVIGTGTIPRIGLTEPNWWLHGCVEVDLAGIELPATLTVSVTTSEEGYLFEETVVVEECGETATLTGGSDGQGWLRVGAFVPNLRACYTDYAGVVVDWSLSISLDGGATWSSGGSGSFTYPGGGVNAYSYVPWIWGTGSVMYQITGTMYPPPGAVDLLPSDLSGSGSVSGARDCGSITDVLAEGETFGWADGWGPGGQFSGGIPDEICWEGLTNTTLTRSGVVTWEGFENVNVSTDTGNLCAGSIANADVSFRIRATYVTVSSCVGRWDIERRVPVCSVFGGPLTYRTRRGAGSNFVTVTDSTSNIPAWGVGDGLPDRSVDFAPPGAAGPAIAYTGGTIKLCGGGFMMMAPAPPPAPEARAEAPLAPDDPYRRENLKAFLRIQKEAEAAGCGRKIPVEKRKGCGCSFECLRGHSPDEDGGVTLHDCWACPERPARADTETP